MSAPAPNANKISVKEVMIGLVTTLVISAMIYLVVSFVWAGVYKSQWEKTKKNGNWYKERPTWIPQFLLDWAGYPGTFTKISSMNAPQMALKETMTGVTAAAQCMLKCSGMVSTLDDPECVGFVYDSTAKKCYFAETMDFVMPGPGSNTVYLYQNTQAGYTPSVRTFQAYTSNALPTTGDDAPKNVGNSPFTEGGGYYGCGANCYSNTECTGYTFIPSTSSCRLVSNMDATKLVPTPGSNSYIYTSLSGDEDTTTYWT